MASPNSTRLRPSKRRLPKSPEMVIPPRLLCRRTSPHVPWKRKSPRPMSRSQSRSYTSAGPQNLNHPVSRPWWLRDATVNQQQDFDSKGGQCRCSYFPRLERILPSHQWWYYWVMTAIYNIGFIYSVYSIPLVSSILCSFSWDGTRLASSRSTGASVAKVLIVLEVASPCKICMGACLNARWATHGNLNTCNTSGSR